MTKFVVVAEADGFDVECGTNDVETACGIFTAMCDIPAFFSINLYDGETGEVYAYQTIVHSPEGVTITKWVAN